MTLPLQPKNETIITSANNLQDPLKNYGVYPNKKLSKFLPHFGKNLSLSTLSSVITSFISQNILGLVNKVKSAANKIFKIKFVSKTKLFTSHEKIDKSQNAWLLNLALLKAAADSGELTEEQKKQIQFLASNYLSKTAPIHLKTMRTFFRKLGPLFQVSGTKINHDYYHRFSLHKLIHFGESANHKLAYRSDSPLILTDTVEFQHLLPLKFCVIEKQHPGSDSILTELAQHFRTEGKKALKSPLSHPFLFDLTSTLGQNIETAGNKQKEALFKKEFGAFKSELNTAITQAVDSLILQKPELTRQRSKLIKFVKKNSTCICRIQTENISGIKVLPLFSKIKGSRVFKVHHSLADFIISTGIGMGAVSLRREMQNILDQHKNVHYAVNPKNASPSVRFYPKIKTFTEAAFYQRFSALFGSSPPAQEPQMGISIENFNLRKDEIAFQPHKFIMGKATMDLLTGLFNQIEDAQWEELHNNPVYSQIIQASLFKIRESLATAELHLDNFNEFAQQIELIHAELATLLEIFRPYQTDAFSEIFKEALRPTIPENLHQYVNAGLGKTSVNICAGINEAIRRINPKPHCTYSKGFYFEQAAFVGYENQFEKVLEDDSCPPVDLYFGQFNPNIEIASDFVAYERRDIAKDIHALIDNGKAASQLTVAIDCTIDKYDSENVHGILQEFEKEIENGRLNFVFFRSGQKFDMLGMDGYFGAPFYTVNDGSEKWESFNSLSTQKVHQTDILSHQWFCLANQYATTSLAQYRELIFKNTREILDHVPEKFRPSNPINPKQRIRINTATHNMDACFIDVKVSGLNHKARSIKVLGRFYKKMISKGIKLQTRATFGLYHPNALIISVNEVEDSTTIRLHPGINPEENAAFIEYFRS
ncbi:putative uncharacterized protein [Parachlamydia acanthamoebae UV-7]|uniref:Uncharacterized protein n=2 Tax=Parachlamydia acanthamoebae TaxID=83552 RepID=F8L1F7_PARAV|nr:hypothetical protein [Parachlamydia acanthamoebae]CCB87099.1 putative uncharacterized protein [Parachlamydia acanthamoebae UV-7]